MLELAVFGSMMLLMLGLIVSYGLNADYNQNATMGAFRKAMNLAMEPDTSGEPVGSASYSMVQDRYFADPLHPFSLGSPASVSASASVTRDPRLDASPNMDDGSDPDTLPDGVTELPRLRFDAQGVELLCPPDPADPSADLGPGCLTSYFRLEKNIADDDDFDPETEDDEETIELDDKYKEIYGSTNLIRCDQVTPSCEDPATPGHEFIVLDSCDGHIIDYNFCVTQARQIVDPEVCQTFCERGQPSGSTVDCVAICNEVMNPPNQSDPNYYPARGGAWYAKDYVEVDLTTHRYDFPELLGGAAGIFNAIRSLGVQPKTKMVSVQNLKMEKNETTTNITNSTHIMNWHDLQDRTFKHKTVGQTTQTQDIDFTRFPKCPGVPDSGDPNQQADCGGYSEHTTWVTPHR